jgi:spermidine synthase
VVYEVWRSTLRKIRSTKSEIRNCLILGLGGGSAAKLVAKFWPASQGEPEAEITGVDIDPVMVELGKKYLDLDKLKLKIEIGDAERYISTISHKQSLALRAQPSTIRYDLILVDMYVGDTFPERFASESFLRLVHRFLSDGGIAVFNRLYYGEKRPEAMKFGRKLEKIFAKVEYFYPEANLMLLCYTQNTNV